MTVPFELQNENNTTTKNAKCEKLALYLTICDSQNTFYWFQINIFVVREKL